MGSWAKVAIAAAVGCLILGAPGTGSAAGLSEQQREAMLQQMIARPNDLDLAFEYAHASADAGDYEGAISALERMLIYAPNTPRIQFELGVLYYKLGAYDVARSYFEQVLANPSVPNDVAEQVRLYIQQLAIAADPPPFSASIFSAIRWESNANFGPGSNSVTLNGIDFTLGDQSVGRPGWSALNIGTLHYSHDLKQQGDRLEFDFLAYSTIYFDDELSDIDLDFFEFTFGPSFNMKRFAWDQTRLFVYGIGDLAYLGYDSYFYAPGAGVRLLSFSATQSVLDARLETRYRDFQDNSDLPTNSLRTGWQTRLGANYSYYFTPGFVMTTQAYVQREDAEVSFYSDWELALSLGFAWTFKNPVWNAQYPLTWQVGGGIIRRDYDDPDPTINIYESERDDTWWTRTALVIPVAETWALVPQVEYRDQQSNYDLRTFDDLTTLLGVQKRF
ncbi:MAG: tetratricopeptide repeat protein [Methyloceanibacter sp.]|uniref:tetratricopeptide repeat protein n=1 Tax=Methyloceanibacter sp. TaxID=1965321 RepID=UPI001DACD303|nr:tetratricopeptide repeat protein [Methyloceanibacter sp.]MCB1444077.1 tetratricopeptide repeat protein [Methyloceanibacter sp.]MCC0057935.1 tetratricopeptide repeat protein [Hyphomicrobiaceae bacterium]